MALDVHKAPIVPGNYLIERDAGIWECCEVAEDYMTREVVIRFCGCPRVQPATDYCFSDYNFIGPIHVEDLT